ncbi:MAG: family 65 glycosyl hydrolase domain-containing protein [Bacteroidota bacterium]|nr:family 65 glycosyl hydrolase domain-containing protein [Bacteroidota bacterium]
MSPELIYNEWLIIEEGFFPEKNRASESIFSIGNGKIGQRANFEEQYSGDSLQGSYVAGIYYPDKTRVGWWKNGYPEYFAKVLNAANWIGINIEINGEVLDLAKWKVINFRRVLNMKEGFLERTFTAESGNRKIEVETKRFLSIVDTETGVIRLKIKALNFSGNIRFTPYIDLDVKNEDSNYNEKFWDEISSNIDTGAGHIIGKTKKSNFYVSTGMKLVFEKNQNIIQPELEKISRQKFIANTTSIPVQQNDELVIYKYAVNITSEDHSVSNLTSITMKLLESAVSKGFFEMLSQQKNAWVKKWEESDIVIKGDVAAQQGIRFNIFQMNQTYTGEDERLNIGPKGFTGEKYGGSTYWDTEAYALPFYLSTAKPEVARKLLMYRYKHLKKAIENAEKLGFINGAALYPMVTMNGEECHNEWEITFEEIHRNGAIAFAIYNYTRYTGDNKYINNYGVDVLIALSRFWSQRVNFSPEKGQYVILGVTGPNEYENNVNNNWYTNTIATWTLEYTIQSLDQLKKDHPEKFADKIQKLNFKEAEETVLWKRIIQNMHYPYHENEKVFLQQDGYLDKEQLLVSDIDTNERPINQYWSWDRILRSPFIKQADVLQGIYMLEERFDQDCIKRNFNYYEPRTVHESSLSACLHSILASKTGDIDRAYDFYLQTARLDLDDYNKEVEEGLHITSMAGTWMSVVEGFGGMRVRNNLLNFSPLIPQNWTSYSFNVRFRKNILNLYINEIDLSLSNISGESTDVVVYNKKYHLEKGTKIKIERIQ